MQPDGQKGERYVEACTAKAAAVAQEHFDAALAQEHFVLATEEYEAIVANCADQDLAVELSNRHMEHAAVLTNHIIRKTENELDILTGSMPELFFKKIKENFESALKKQVTLRLIFVRSPSSDCGLLSLRNQYSNLKIFEIKNEFKDTVKDSICHFCVSDKKRFRVEDIHPEKDFTKDPSVKAIASFNYPEVARDLHVEFDQLLAMSRPVEPSIVTTPSI